MSTTTATVPGEDDAWASTRDEYLAGTDLTTEERQQLLTSSRSDVFEELQSLETKHAQESKSRIAANRLSKVFEGLKTFSKALDVFVNADSHGVLALVWGSLRIVLGLAMRWRNTVEMMVDFLEGMGPPLGRLDAYERLSPSSARLQDALTAVYRQFLALTHSMRCVLRISKGKKLLDKVNDKLHKSKKWLDFDGQISGGIVKIQRLCDSAEKEAKLAIESDKQRKELLRWLDGVSFDKDLSRFKKSTSNGTCQWMLNHPTISAWAEADKPGGRLIWVKGIPGCGKTRLAASVVDTFDVKLYFFCDTKEEGKREAMAIVRTLLSQLLQLNFEGAALSAAVRMYENGAVPTMTGLKSVLKEILHLTPCRIILDGLDECPGVEREDILELCTDLVEDCSLLVFSRDLPDIATALHSVGTKAIVQELAVTRQDNQADIETYLREAVPDLNLDDTALENMILQQLTDGARGMFLWARLMIEHLAGQITPKEIVTSLNDLPRDLNGVYSRFLNAIPGSQRIAAHKILQWLVCASRPLTLRELETAFAIEPGKFFVDPTCRMIAPEKRLRSFGSMIVLEDEGPLVRLVHASLKDFLLDQNLVSESFGSMIVEPSETNHYLAAACLTYLTFDRDFPASKKGDQTRQEAEQDLDRHFVCHPFLEYSCLNWWHHLEHSRGYKRLIDEELQKMLLTFVSNNFRSVSWLQALSYAMGYNHHTGISSRDFIPIPSVEDFLSCCRDAYHLWCSRIFGHFDASRYIHFIISGPLSPLQIASLFDFSDVVVSELSRGVPPDSRDWFRQGALHWAAYGGSINSTKLLLKYGADPHLFNCVLETPLHYCVSYGTLDWDASSHKWCSHFEILSLLVDAGSSVSMLNVDRQTALLKACNSRECDFQEQAIELLLSAMSPEETRLVDINNRTALDLAAERGYHKTVQRLLDHGCIDIHFEAGKKCSNSIALVRACYRAGNRKVVELLIENGCDINGVDHDLLLTPLHVAARWDSALVTILLSKNAHVSQADRNGRIPLHYAVSGIQIDSVRLLLEAGSNPLAIDATGRTVLGLAASIDNDSIVEMMLQHLFSRDSLQGTQLKACHLPSAAAQSSPQARRALALDIDNEMSMKLGLSETDVRHVLFLLKTKFRSKAPRRILATIIDLAECWVASSVSRADYIKITEESVEAIYLRSQPIRGREREPVQKIVFTTKSHDQGWSDYPESHHTYNFSQSFFDLHHFRQGNPEALPPRLRIISNIHASLQTRMHIVTWLRGPLQPSISDRWRCIENLIRSIETGDSIAIVPKAMYKGWENHVESAQIDIYTSFLPAINAQSEVTHSCFITFSKIV